MLYLITYDLEQPQQLYSKLYETINVLGSSCYRCMESAWLLNTEMDVESCANLLGMFLNYSDRLFIVDVSHQSMQGRLPQRAWDWMKKNDC